jgi:hypothetical protein
LKRRDEPSTASAVGGPTTDRELRGHARPRTGAGEMEKVEVVEHAPDCGGSCGGTYVCNRCEKTFGWCIGACDDTPSLCDDCANIVQE